MKAEDVVGTAARERYKLNNFRVPIEDAVEARKGITLTLWHGDPSKKGLFYPFFILS